MPAVRSLRDLARRAAEEPQVALRRVLTLVCELLAMDVAFVSVIDDAGNRTVRLSVYSDGTLGPTGFTEPLETTWCGLVVRDDGVLVDDARGGAAYDALPLTAALGIVSYAGVPLRGEDGEAVGTLCALGHVPHASLNQRDSDVLRGLAEIVGPLVTALDQPGAPVPWVPVGLAGVAAAVEDAHDVERLSRPLLGALRDLTGMASAYLTVVHEEDGVQEIRYADNARADFELPEGLLVPWDDTLCKRALEEGRACTTDVPAVWGDSRAARALDILVYISVPVRTDDGRLWGTLCAADSVAAGDVEAHLPTMRLFARLIGSEVEREAAAQRARRELDTDPLTGCASRRVVQPWLFDRLRRLSPDEVVVALYVKILGLHEVNRTFGDRVGDALLVEAAGRLRAVARRGDLVARMSGNELLVAACVPRGVTMALTQRVRAAVSFSLPRDGAWIDVGAAVGVATSDGNDGPSLVTAAYADMVGTRHTR